ncbi:MAG: ComEA family DNA-binding protein [Sumerlaeia bacterium]
MFRGLTRAEQLIAIAVALTLALGATLSHLQSKRQAQTHSVTIVSAQPWQPASAPVSLAADAPPAVANVIDIPAARTGDPRVDLNTASAELLATLPGIGEVKAEAIVIERERNGPFRSVGDLQRVSGIGGKTAEALVPHAVATAPETAPPPVSAGFSPRGAPSANSGFAVQGSPPAEAGFRAPGRVTPSAPALPVVRLNTASQEELMSLDGIGEKIATRILLDRAANGPYRSIDDLERVRGIGPKTIAKNRHRLAL